MASSASPWLYVSSSEISWLFMVIELNLVVFSLVLWGDVYKIHMHNCHLEQSNSVHLNLKFWLVWNHSFSVSSRLFFIPLFKIHWLLCLSFNFGNSKRLFAFWWLYISVSQPFFLFVITASLKNLSSPPWGQWCPYGECTLCVYTCLCLSKSYHTYK